MSELRARAVLGDVPTPPSLRRSNLAFESQHLLHALESNNVKRWVSLSEGQAGTLGWLTVRNLLLSTLAWSNTQPCCVADE